MKEILYGFNLWCGGLTVCGKTVVYADDWPAYRGIADRDTRHETVNHSAEEWVRGSVHTNTVENIWSLFKRSVMGSYHRLPILMPI